MTPILSTKVMTSPANINNFGIGWLKIPTTATNNLYASWGTSPADANHLDTRPTNGSDGDYSINGGDMLTMLIARKFNSDESKKIFDALANQSRGTIGGSRKGKNVSGYNFVFTKQGHISFIPSDGTSDQVTYLNPMINPSSDISDTTEEAGDGGIGVSTDTGGKLEIKKTGSGHNQSNTMDGDGANGIGIYSGKMSYRGGRELVHAMGPKVVMNKASTYILYTPADQDVLLGSDKTAAEAAVDESKYYLLYNPIHSMEFRKFYQSLMQTNASLDDGPSYTKPHYTYGATLTAHDPAGCRDVIPVPGIKTIFARYCNAFQVKGLRTNSAFHYLEHYADPVCPYILSETSAQQAHMTNTNTTHKSTREYYYRLTGTSTAYDSWNAGASAFSASRDDSVYNTLLWACPNHGIKSGNVDDNIHGWIRSNGWLGKNSTSFIKDVIIGAINSGNWVGTNQSALSINRIGEKDTQEEPQCRHVDVTYLRCESLVQAGGNITGGNIVQQNQCGFGRSDKEPVKQGNERDKHECHTVLKVPDCPNWGTPGDDAKEITVGGKKVWTGCCQVSNDLINYSNCQPKNGGVCSNGYDGGQIAGGANEEYLEGSDEFLLTQSLQMLSRKITKASDVALTSKMAYPTDVFVTTKCDIIAEETTQQTGVVSNIQNDISSLSVNNNKTEIEGKISTLQDSVIETEQISKELVIYLANTYILGYKKMYVFGGIGLLIFLIILIALLKK